MSFKFLDNYNFIPFAHRGGSYDFCENTLDAFNNSINLGYRHIETDVRHTKDNKLIIFHDPDLKRILGLDTKIENLNYEELKNIKIFETHTIPLLDDALSSWPEINFNIEPKSLESAHLLKDKLKSMVKNGVYSLEQLQKDHGLKTKETWFEIDGSARL